MKRHGADGIATIRVNLIYFSHTVDIEMIEVLSYIKRTRDSAFHSV